MKINFWATMCILHDSCVLCGLAIFYLYYVLHLGIIRSQINSKLNENEEKPNNNPDYHMCHSDIQWNLQRKDTLGTELLSFLRRLSLSRRLMKYFNFKTFYIMG